LNFVHAQRERILHGAAERHFCAFFSVLPHGDGVCAVTSTSG
jgi:hypothetical protein